MFELIAVSGIIIAISAILILAYLTNKEIKRSSKLTDESYQEIESTREYLKRRS